MSSPCFYRQRYAIFTTTNLSNPLHNTSSPAASLGDPLVHSNARSRWLALLWNPWGYMTWEINYAQGYPNYLGFRGATVVHHSLHHGKRMKRKEKERKRGQIIQIQ